MGFAILLKSKLVILRSDYDFCLYLIFTMLKNKTLLLVIGFLLAGTGFLAIVLSMVGLQFTFLIWLDAGGKALGFLWKILIMLAGFILIYLGGTNFENETDPTLQE